MKQSHRSSVFNITIDLNRSRGAYLYDLTTDREVLDLFGMYSSLPLGYNHAAFRGADFARAVEAHAGVKIANCEMATPAVDAFLEEFTGHRSMAPFSHFHFCSTGALAIEAAVKTALVARGHRKIATFAGSFHGINGYGGLLASLEGPAAQRLDGLPSGTLATVFDDPTSEHSERVLHELDDAMAHNQLAAVLVEPIQCTAGDRVMDVAFLTALRALCSGSGIPLIFDEIQTGFGGTGTLWYFERLGFVPDIVVFGKKTQVSGVMVREAFGAIFRQPSRLEVTWDGDALDMIRCRTILEEYARGAILDNVKWRGEQFQRGLDNLGVVHRRVGLLIALDFEDRTRRDNFVRRMWREEATIMIPTGSRCVRWRPHLAITAAEANDAIRRTGRAMKAVAA